MMKYNLRIVPDISPNDDGKMIEAEIPCGINPFDCVPVKYHHVVYFEKSRDPQDGGPMHAAFLYQPPAKYQFNADWLKK